MDEQIVPTFALSCAPLKRCATIPSKLPAFVSAMEKSLEVPDRPSSVRPRAISVSPAPEFKGNLRWETPLRASRHCENWQGARELGLDYAVRSRSSGGVMAVMRRIVADVVVGYVGGGLPKATVEKWLCLLCEYLEMNADEVVLVVCLLRRYIREGGRFIAEGDWARPQRWECVVGVSCYLAVLLTEEFPGRTVMDLKELLGPNFRFGREQIAFLKVVNWRISISGEVFGEVKRIMEGVLKGLHSAQDTIMKWFKVEEAVLKRKRKAAKDAGAMVATQTAREIQTQQIFGKKRGYAAFALEDDFAVPRIIVPRLEAVHHIPAAYVPAVQAVPHWALQSW